jgi:hypothetical protein
MASLTKSPIVKGMALAVAVFIVMYFEDVFERMVGAAQNPRSKTTPPRDREDGWGALFRSLAGENGQRGYWSLLARRKE